MPAGSMWRINIARIAASSITNRRATVYFSPVSAMRARTCLLNTLSSVTPVPHGDAARALIAWFGSDRIQQQREPAALVLTAAIGAGHGKLGVRQALLPALRLLRVPGSYPPKIRVAPATLVSSAAWVSASSFAKGEKAILPPGAAQPARDPPDGCE